MADITGNFADNFDDDLQLAVKTYQHNFNLNPTGELDMPTLTQIVRPRCGVADIMNGTSSMNSDWSPAADRLHAVAHFSFFPGAPRWRASKTHLTYAFLPENHLTDSVKAVFARAFSRWSEVIPMNFTETASFTRADIQVGFFAGDHADGAPFDGSLGTLAHAFSPPSGMFHLDGDENWVVDGEFGAGSSVVSAVDLESVAIHEIGHLLGLGHSSVEEAIMFPTLPAATRKVKLADDDIRGIQALYGSNPNYNGSSTSTTHERETSGRASHIGTPLLGMGFLLTVGSLTLTFYYFFFCGDKFGKITKLYKGLSFFSLHF
ncbi:Interstitial collagenase [Bertholletia excelsa]